MNAYIGSRNEWDPLEEVVIGRIDNAQIPRPAVDLHTIEYADRELESQIPSGPFSSEVVAQTRDDLEKLCETLTSLGIKVRRPDVTSHATEFGTTEWKTDGFYNYCPRDVLLAIDDLFIETPMALRARYLEPFAYRSLLQEYFEAWGSIAQLAAEYETIAVAAQHDRWTTLITTSGLTTDQVQEVIDSDAFGALTAELRRAEANHHNVEALLPRLIKARGFADAGDIASVIHHRLANATTRPAGSGRTRQAPRLIAGLIPEATGPMTPDMQQALTERRRLIETRAEAVLDTALHTQEPWVTALGPMPAGGRERQQWRRRALVVAAYRDRYQITDPAPLGTQAEGTVQKIDRARAETALRTLTRPTIEDERRRPTTQATRQLDL